MHGVVNPVGESSKLMGREIPWTKNKLGVNFVSRKALWGRTVSMRLSKTIFKLVVTQMSDFADKQSYRSADKGGEGVQNTEHCADVLNGSPLIRRSFT